MNPYISSENESSGVVSVNKITSDDFGDITLPLSNLSDTEISTAQAGQLLTFNGTKWINSNGGNAITTLSGLTDCTVTDLEDGQFMKYDASTSKWINYSLMNANEAGTLTQMHGSYGGGVDGMGIVQNEYKTIAAYVDNSYGSSMLTLVTRSTSGTITSLRLIKETDYTIDTDPSSGNPRIKNLRATNIQGYYNNLAIIWHELGRRIYPVVRDANTIKLTDGTHTVTMTSTSSGYSIGQSIDVTLSNPSLNQVLQYDGSKWVNATIGLTALSLLTDVNVTTPLNNQVLQYDTNTSKWKNATPAVGFNPTTNNVRNNDVLVYSTDGNIWTNLSSLVRYRKKPMTAIYVSAPSFKIPTSATNGHPKGLFSGYKLLADDGSEMTYSFTLPFDYKLNSQLILQLNIFTATIPVAGQNKITIKLSERSVTTLIDITLDLSSCWNKIFLAPTTLSQFAGASSVNDPMGFYIARSNSGVENYGDYIYLVEACILYQSDSYGSSSYTDKA